MSTGISRTFGLLLLVVAAMGIHAHEIGKLRNDKIPVPPRGEAQCVVAQASHLPGGAKAEGKPGDYILRNHFATFVVAAPRIAGGYSRYGGRLLDAVLNEPGHDEDLLGELFFATADEKGLLNIRLLRAVKAEIVSPGGNGTPAHLRVEAVDDRFPIVDTTVRLPSSAQGLVATIDYVLPPDSPTLLISCKLTNTTQQAKTYTLFWGMIQGDGLVTFLPPWGTADYAMREAGGPPLLGLVEMLQARLPMVAMLGSRIGYGVIMQDEAISQVLKAEQIYLLALGRPLSLPSGQSGQLQLALSVSDGDMEPLRAEARRLRRESEALTKVSGRVVTAGGGSPVANARVYLLQQSPSGKSQMYTATRTDRRGRFEAQVPPGDYQVAVFADGYSPAVAEVAPGTMVQLERPAHLRFRVYDDKQAFLPCALVFERLSGAIAKQERSRLGEEGDYGRFDRVYFSIRGNETIPVEPGRYRITFTRGFEYEIDQQEVELQPGRVTTLSATLRRVAQMPGYLSGDFHVHAMPSPDSSDPLADKVKAYAAMGVQVLTSTDHDVLTDYQPVIRQLGLQRWITSVVGCEISPNFGLGHFNAYPQRYNPSKPNNGAIEWYDLSAEQIFAAARRNNDGDTIVQVNHPRGSGAAYFSWVGLDPIAGTTSRPQEFSPNFDVIEVFNGTDANQLAQTLPDWFYFLNRGRRYIAVGNTDSHHAYRLEPGFPRTYLYFGHEQVQRVTPGEIVRAIRGGNVLVCGGPLVNMRVQGKPAGATVVSNDGLVNVEVSVASASWVRTNRLKIYVNGEVAHELPIEHAPGKPLEWRQSISVRVSQDSWLLAVVEGEGFTALYSGLRPCSFTNPIYVDLNGDGWKPPKAIVP